MTRQVLAWLLVLWAVLTVGGIVVHLQGIATAVGDLRLLRYSDLNGIRLIVARGWLGRHSKRLAIMALMMSMGIGPAIKPALSTGCPVNGWSIYSSCALIAIAMFTDWLAVGDMVERRRLIAKLKMGPA